VLFTWCIIKENIKVQTYYLIFIDHTLVYVIWYVHIRGLELRGIRFRTVPEILQAVDRSIRTISTTGAAKGILRLPHRWQRVVHNAGDYIEGQ